MSVFSQVHTFRTKWLNFFSHGKPMYVRPTPKKPHFINKRPVYSRSCVRYRYYQDRDPPSSLEYPVTSDSRFTLYFIGIHTYIWNRTQDRVENRSEVPNDETIRFTVHCRIRRSSHHNDNVRQSINCHV